MAGIYDQTRLLVAKREDEDHAAIIGAMPESTWEVIPPEDWITWKHARAHEAFDRDHTSYDYIEVIITTPSQQLADMFNARELTPTTIALATEEPA